MPASDIDGVKHILLRRHSRRDNQAGKRRHEPFEHANGGAIRTGNLHFRQTQRLEEIDPIHIEARREESHASNVAVFDHVHVTLIRQHRLRMTRESCIVFGK